MSINRNTPPQILDATSFKFELPPYNTQTCDNGIVINYVNAGVQEVVNFEIVFEAGSWNQAKNGVAWFAASLLQNGTSTKSALEINNTIEFYGASLKVANGPDYATLSISCLSKNLKELLPLVFEIITDAQFSDDELNVLKKNTAQRLLINLKKTDFNANRAVDVLLFGFDHPYGTYVRSEDIDGITREDLLEHVRTWYRYNNCKVFLAGKFDDALLTQIANLFGTAKWNEGEQKSKSSQPIVLTKERVHRIQLDEANLQGSIRLVSPFVERTHEDYVPMYVLNALYGGYFGSRLMSNIREEKGYTYGIYSYLYNNKREGALAVSTEAGKEVCEAAIAEIYKEMQLLHTEVIDEEELQLVKNYILGGLYGDLDGPFNILARWKNLILNGFTKERFESNINIYKNIKAEELQVLAKKYLQPELFYELVVS
jgi:zinc protease